MAGYAPYIEPVISQKLIRNILRRKLCQFVVVVVEDRIVLLLSLRFERRQLVQQGCVPVVNRRSGCLSECRWQQCGATISEFLFKQQIFWVNTVAKAISARCFLKMLCGLGLERRREKRARSLSGYVPKGTSR
jgi:hypothetical protein